MNARGAPRDRLGRLRDEDLVSQAVDAGGLDEDARERLQRLADGLLSLPAAEASALLLRELDGLTYEEIAQAAGVTSAGARRAVYRARIGLQGNVVPPTTHCDEVRVAMSKAETSVRDRRSITAHLERCPVCAEFADELERRPGELRLLFGETDTEERTAALAAAGAAGVGAGAGAAELAGAVEPPVAVGAAEAAENGAGAPPPRARREPSDARRRRQRRLFVPLVLLLLLAGGGVALAIVLSSGGGKSHKTTARTPPPAQNATPSRGATTPAAPHKPKPRPHKAANKAHKAGQGAKKQHGARKHRKRHGAPAVAAATGAAKGQPSGTPSVTERESSAQAGYSARGGSVEQEVHGGLPSTGLQIAIVVAAALFLIGLGMTLRGLTYRRG